MPANPLDNAFGETLRVWVVRVSAQVKDIEDRLGQQRAATIEMNQELGNLEDSVKESIGEAKGQAKDYFNDLNTKLSLLMLQVVGIENRLKSLEDNRNKVVGFVMLSFATAVAGLVFAQKK